MSLLIATKSELIKTRRSASFWMSLIGSAFIPLIFFLTYVFNPGKNLPRLQEAAWETHMMQGWQAFSAFLLPMFVVLICSLIPQLEYKINGHSLYYRWKNCIKGFNMPLKMLSGGRQKWIHPREEWQSQKMGDGFSEKSFSIDQNFYVTVKKIKN